jgi:hypothetical protein
VGGECTHLKAIKYDLYLCCAVVDAVPCEVNPTVVACKSDSTTDIQTTLESLADVFDATVGSVSTRFCGDKTVRADFFLLCYLLLQCWSLSVC